MDKRVSGQVTVIQPTPLGLPFTSQLFHPQAHPDSASLQSAPPRAAAAPADLAAVTAWVAGRPAAEVRRGGGRERGSGVGHLES